MSSQGGGGKVNTSQRSTLGLQLEDFGGEGLGVQDVGEHAHDLVHQTGVKDGLQLLSDLLSLGLEGVVAGAGGAPVGLLSSVDSHEAVLWGGGHPDMVGEAVG